MGPDTRLHLIVLFGGQSAEHDVSCVTAAHVLRAIDPARYRVTPVGIGRDGRWMHSTSTIAALTAGPQALPGTLDPAGDAVAPSAVLVPAERTVVVPLLHGPLGEDGTVQGLLELAGLPYVGSGVLGSALCMDKAAAKSMAAHAALPQPRHVALRADGITPATVDSLIAELGLPVFVKPANMGSSIGVSKAGTADDVRSAIEVALGYDEWVVVEEAISGREIEVAVLGDLDPRASLPGEIIPGAEFYDYADKYLEDRSQAVVPADLTSAQVAEVQSLAVRAFGALRCSGLARVDFFLEEGGRGFLLNEVNTMPGFTPISMYPKLWIASGLPYPALIDELVRLAIERHARQRRNTSR
ncbi:MAG: D-alanine--D-alanine ligase family protein [Ilumatobacteraceae bacterium]